MYVSELIIRAAIQAKDYDADGTDDDAKYIGTTLSDWVDYYNSALKSLVRVRPDSNYEYVSGGHQLTANETRQSLPATGVSLIDIPRNLGPLGTAPGAVITRISEDDMAMLANDWHSMTGDTEIQHFSYNPKTPSHFSVYPRVHATTKVYVDLCQSIHFTEVLEAAIDSTLVEPDSIYHNALECWMLKKAYEKDTDSPNNFQIAQQFERMFFNDLGVEFKTKAAISSGGKK